MKKYGLILAIIWSNVWLVRCTPRRKRDDSVEKFHRTGEAIAVDYKIQEYEREHQKFYIEQTKDGAHLKWPALYNKNLSNYCRKYLQHIVPTRSIDTVSGIQNRIMLHYEKENPSIFNEIVMVHCKIVFNLLTVSYYMTRAPELDCVYALKSTGRKVGRTFTIIFKHCNFENKPLILEPLKSKNTEIINKIHRRTGQPIAKDEYLYEYELEHHEMMRKQKGEDKFYEWLFAKVQLHLEVYCYQYIGECVSAGDRDSITGFWKTEKLYYQKLDTNMENKVIIITCQSHNPSKRQYHITRAPESNCVYALLRKGLVPGNPFVIIYKHCNFENSNEKT